MAIKLVIFDLDGTLVDSSIDITNAINYAIEPFSIPPLTPSQTIKLVGEGITRLMEKIVNESLGRSAHIIDRDLLVNSFLQYYSEHLLDNTKAYPKVEEVLQRLNNLKKAVISNKREYLTTEILKGLKLLQYIDLVVGSDTTPERKPSAVPILYVLSQLNIPSNQAVIVGDSSFDIIAGKRANIKTIGVTYGYRPAETLKDADFLIASFDELPNILMLI
ncbi:MAG: HAD-IA family hydrolase [Thermodesulfovibrionales bacterium]|nr:HAD-IA family hydrolase [Thermodesulfovibrionales bacterium]